MVFGSGDGDVHSLAGTTDVPQSGAIFGQWIETPTGARLDFRPVTGGTTATDPIATLYLTDPRKLESDGTPIVGPENVDPTGDLAFVTPRNYTFKYSYSYDRVYSSGRGPGYRYDLTEEFDVVIAPDMMVDAATAAATGLTEGESLSSGMTMEQAQTWADYQVDGKILDFKAELRTDQYYVSDLRRDPELTLNAIESYKPYRFAPC